MVFIKVQLLILLIVGKAKNLKFLLGINKILFCKILFSYGKHLQNLHTLNIKITEISHNRQVRMYL